MTFLGLLKGIDFRFPSGEIAISGSTRAICEKAAISPNAVVARHLRGNWGDIGTEIHITNVKPDVVIQRIANGYRLPTGEHVWVVTDTQRSTTALIDRLGD